MGALTETVVPVSAAVFTGLVAGLMFAFSVAVNGGLHRLKDSSYLAAMQSINRVILNPAFFVCFFAPVILLPLSAYFALHQPDRFGLLVAAAVLYAGGCILVTAAGNVPLNRKLAVFDLTTASGDAQSAMRKIYEKPWNRLHRIRTMSSIISAILCITAVAI